jgi:hypothetical protein
MRLALFFALVAFCTSSTVAQLSGYSSVGYGYHQNPLYNYAKLSDQMKVAYLELAYQKDGENSTLNAKYSGGLTLFNRHQDRNYYEHGLVGLYTLHLTGAGKEAAAQEEESTEEETEKPPSYSDSTGSYLTAGIRISGRHDKALRQDFDNRGAELRLAYRFATGERTFGRVLNTVTYRSYPSVAELSNWNDILSAELASWTDGGMIYGVSASAGVKYYTTSVFDTTRFETTTSAQPGKGKGGGNQGTTAEAILLQPRINGAVQITAGLFLRKDWSTQSSLSAVAMYRLTPRYAERYLAPLTPEAGLTEDLHADFFGYKGPEMQVRLTQPLFAGIQSILGCELQYKTFGFPALDLEGNEIEPIRKDIRSSLELYLSRYFELAGEMGLDVSLGMEVARNQSNDRYNDFSTYSVAFGIGIGF